MRFPRSIEAMRLLACYHVCNGVNFQIRNQDEQKRKNIKLTTNIFFKTNVFLTEKRLLFNDTYREKLCLTQFSTRIYWNDNFYVYTINWALFIPLSHNKKYRCLNEVNDFYSKNLSWFVLLTQENALPLKFHFKATRKSIASSKKPD